MRRFLKQLLYGLFYLVLLAGLSYGVYWFVSRPTVSCFDNVKNQNEEDIDCGGECIPCALKNIQSIKSSAYFLFFDGINNAVITLENPNAKYGAKEFSYTLNVYKTVGAVTTQGSSRTTRQILFSLTRNSFIYPAERKTIIEPNLKFDVKQMVGNIEVIVSDPVWVSSDEFTKPDVRVKATETRVVKQQAEINGIISNLEPLELEKVIINVLVQDPELIPIGVTRTVFSNLKPFEERVFEIFVPLRNVPKGKMSVLFWAEALK